MRGEAEYFLPLTLKPRFIGAAPLCLSLSLFMFGVFADYPDDPFSFYDLAFIADFFDGCPDFHFPYPVVSKIAPTLLKERD